MAVGGPDPLKKMLEGSEYVSTPILKCHVLLLHCALASCGAVYCNRSCPIVSRCTLLFEISPSVL